MQYVLLEGSQIPISIDDVKTWLNIDHDYHDSLIDGLIASAFEFVEDYTGLTFRPQKWQLLCSPAEASKGLSIVKNPFIGIEEITLLTDQGSQILKSDQYHLTVASSHALFLVTDLPALRLAKQTYNSVSFIFNVDYGSLPDSIKMATFQIIAFLYENRGDTAAINNNNCPPEAKLLLDSKRIAFL